MYIKQLSIFVENKPGRLAEITDIIAKNSLAGLEVSAGSQNGTLRDFVIVSPTGLLGVRDLKRKGVDALYHGAFEIVQKPDHTGFYLVNLVEIQEYLKGVVPNEMPVRFGLEALKAQAIVARTYTIYKIVNGSKHQDADICDSASCCQAWISKEERFAKWNEAESESNWQKIVSAVEATKDSIIEIGAQNCHWAANGAFTGEISADMLKSFGVKYAIIGHSERRQYFGETDETVNLRTKAALKAGLKVLLCLGEVKDERLNGITDEIVSMQTKLDLKDITEEQLANVIIAYEPVWAIGTGLTATPEQADETCGAIRNVVAELYGADAAEEIIIQYGGSMNEKNAAELLSKVNVDGGLIGGASLKTDKFTAIVKAANA